MSAVGKPVRTAMAFARPNRMRQFSRAKGLLGVKYRSYAYLLESSRINAW
jgi:hypothetical protein